MKFYTFPLLAVVLSTLFVTTDAAAILWDSASSNNVYRSASSPAQSQTPTEFVFRFLIHTDVTKSSGALTITASSAIFANTGATTCTVSTSGAIKSNAPACTASSTSALVVTAHADEAITAGFITVTVTANIAANPTSSGSITFTADSTESDDSASTNDNTGWTYSDGKPVLYYVKSECREGAPKFTNGAVVSCAEDNCKTCSGKHSGFVVTTGKQTGNTCITGSSTDKNYRCDAIYFTDTSVDVAVSTEGLFGTLTCGALTEAQTAPTNNIMNEIYHNTNIKSANSVYINEEDKDNDQVLSLTGLESDMQYDIYCHMDNAAMSQKLTVWTAENDRIWGDSLFPAVYTAGDSPVTITLTFSHGKTLVEDDEIKLTNLQSVSDDVMIFAATDGTTTCTGTSSKISGEVVKSTTIADSGKTLKLVVAGLDSNSPKTGSKAGSEVVIVCSGNLAANPANTKRITYDLTVAKHPVTLVNRVGWKVQ